MFYTHYIIIFSTVHVGVFITGYQYRGTCRYEGNSVNLTLLYWSIARIVTHRPLRNI